MSKRDPRDCSSLDSIFCCKAVPGVDGTDFAGVFNGKASKARGWRCGGGVKRWSAALSRSACEPEKDSTSWSPNRSNSSSFLGMSDFFFLTYLFLWVILIICSSVKEAQILQSEIKVTQGSSPLPASLHVGQKLCVSKEWQKWWQFKNSGLIFIALMRRHIENAIKNVYRSLQAWVETKAQNTEISKIYLSSCSKTLTEWWMTVKKQNG